MTGEFVHLNMPVIIGAFTCLTIGFIIGVFIGKSRGIPFVGKKNFRWSIGIYIGESPFSLFPPNNLKNPVLTAKDISDVPADFVADPFMIHENNKWYMFFEIMNEKSKKGEIGLAESDDGLNWTYNQVILSEPFHLSYPYVFKWENEYYMIPEACQTNSVRLYKAVKFPAKWQFLTTLVIGYPFVDASVIYFQDKWWMFTAVTNSILHLYYAETLIGPWTIHPQSPIVMGDLKKSRPAGRVIVFQDKIIRYTQNDSLTYGNQVQAFKITELTTTNYKEKEVITDPALKASGSGWNAKGMHHIDVHQISNSKWIACVDGYREDMVFGLRY